MKIAAAIFFCVMASPAAALCVDPSSDAAGQIAYLVCSLEEKAQQVEILQKTIDLQGQAIISNGNNISSLRDENQNLVMQIDRLVDRIEALEAKN